MSLAALPEYADNNKWLNILKINTKIYKKRVLEIIMKLKKNNIEVRPIWYPNHLQKKFKSCQKYEVKNDLAKDHQLVPLDLYFCKDCYHVQLGHIVDPHILYQKNYTYVLEMILINKTIKTPKEKP